MSFVLPAYEVVVSHQTGIIYSTTMMKRVILYNFTEDGTVPFKNFIFYLNVELIVGVGKGCFIKRIQIDIYIVRNILLLGRLRRIITRVNLPPH